MKSRNFLITVIIILVLVNIGTLAFIWIHRPGKERGNPDSGDFLVRELGLDSKQQIIQRALLLNHRNKMKDLRMKEQALHTRFFNMLTKWPSDSVRMKQMTDSLGMLRIGMEESTFRYFDQLRRILSPVQQGKFDTVFWEILSVILPIPPPPPPAPPPPPPGELAPPPPPPPPQDR